MDSNLRFVWGTSRNSPTLLDLWVEIGSQNDVQSICGVGILFKGGMEMSTEMAQKGAQVGLFN